VPFELVARHLPRRGEHGERDRQVEAGALLPQLRRREVDGDSAARELELGGRDPAADALARLVQRLVGEPDDRERRYSVLDVRLHLDAARLETDERMGDRACEHTPTLCAETSRNGGSSFASYGTAAVGAESACCEPTALVPVTVTRRAKQLSAAVGV
jgi:hypothetical protein